MIRFRIKTNRYLRTQSRYVTHARSMTKYIFLNTLPSASKKSCDTTSHMSLIAIKMAGLGDFVQLVAFIFTLTIPAVAAFDAGDAIALVLGLVIGILGVCACLGYYARRRAS